LGVTTAAVALVAGTLAATVGPAAAAPVAGSSSTEKVIVVLRDQLGATPANRTHVASRPHAARTSQQAVLNRLSGAAPTNLKHFTVGNAFSATVAQAQAAALAADPAVASVSADQPVSVAPPTSAQAAPAQAQAAPAPSPVNPAACSTDPAKPLLEPEALSTMNVRSDNPAAKTAAALGIDGTGVKVAYIADGINPNNPGFLRKNGTSAITDYQDFYGDGPNAPTGGAEAFGDASSVVAQGNVTYDVADFANPSVVTFPGGHCYIRIVGVAPGATMVALKAGSELLPNSAILQAIDYAVTVQHVDVLNESFGGNILPDTGARNTIQVFDEQAVAAGVTVTVSTGDAGITSTIGNPSTSPSVISAGAITDSRIYEQTGYALATRFGNGKWLDRNISSLSSAGITQVGRTIDLSAPGEADWAVCDDSGNFLACTNFRGGFGKIQPFGGTSQSAPLTAGVAALVIQAYRKTHGGASPTPALVKRLLTSTAHDLGLPGDEQGSGEIDARAAVEAALTYPGASRVPAGLSSNVTVAPDQLTLTGAPGTNRTGRVTVTNVGTTALTVVPATRRYATLSSQRQQTTIDAASAQTTPYPTTGAPWVYKTLTFTVPNGADRLNARILWKSGATPGAAGPVVRLSLFTPDGTYAANTRPQGGARPANYGAVDVRRPAAGTWTAVLYTPATTGFTGTVTLQTDTERAVPVGSVSPALFSLPPGASRTVRVTLPTPAVGGDTDYTMSLASSGGHQTAVPVIMRALVPTSSGSGTFAGTITGGNARSPLPGQKFNYAFDVPKGKHDLDVSVTLAKDPGDVLQGTLIDPNGETPSVTSNVTPTGNSLRSLTNIVANPKAGRWYYVVSVADPVTGNQISQNFSGRIAFNQVAVHGAGQLPNSPTASLKAGRPVTVNLVVTNPSPAPIFVQTDARTTKQQVQQLAPQFAGSTFDLPLNVDELSSVPQYLVPPDTHKVALTAASTVPAQVELGSPLGGIDVFGDLKQAQGGSTLSTATVSESGSSYVGQGFWFTYVQEIGPYGPGGAPAATTTLTANATTAGFDSAVSTSTGDPYLSAVDPTADPGTPIRIAPGGSAVIRVTVTPNAKVGSTVRGVLNLVTTPYGVNPLFNTTGDVIAVLPYQYKVS
jgi:hypothetical protein